MAIKENIVKSVSEYFSVLKSISENNSLLWYRGHASDKYELKPYIYRDPYIAKQEKKFMEHFKAKGVKFFKDKQDYYEWLFLMQHYGTPTRLLDWSENAIVALAFASQYRNKDVESDDAVIWCLNPIELNKLNSNDRIINICTDESMATLFNSERTPNLYPLAIWGAYESERIIAQQGVFTLFPFSDSFSLESKEKADTFLYKIIIPSEYIKDIASDLYQIGVNEMSLFPEPESISKEIVRLL